MENPHKWWKEPGRYISWRARAKMYAEYTGGRVDLTDWERDLFVPELLGRIQYVESIFGKLLAICDDQETAKRIGAALMVVVRALPGPGPVEDEVFGGHFLSQVAHQIKTSFLAHLFELRVKYANVRDLGTLRKFVNDVNLAFSPIVSLDSELFHSRYFHFVQIKLPGGQIVYDERPPELLVTLAPFRSWMDEMGRVARTTIESIQAWSKQTHEETKAYFEFLARKHGRAGTRLQVISEMLLIALTVALSAFFLTANDPFSLMKKNAELQRLVFAREADLRASAQQLEAVTHENESLRATERTNRGATEGRETQPPAK